MDNIGYTPKLYGGYNKISEERRKSSSGGIFVALAKEIISENGVVFGAALEIEEGKVTCYHKRCEKICDLDRLLGSKYLQSSIGDTFKEVQSLLNQKRKVLFCGTPCQIGGLVKFLGKEYSNLLLVDFICHGVPNKKLLDKVIIEENVEWPKKLEFRNKKYGWENYSLALYYENNKIVYQQRQKSKFMSMYLTNAYLRPSCYACKTRRNRFADITLGDFWGCEKYLQENDDLKDGYSIVVINSKIGEKFLFNLDEKIFLKEIEMSYFEDANLSYRLDSYRPLDRKLFNKMLDLMKSDTIIRYYNKTYFVRRFLRKIQRLIFKMTRGENL